MYKASNLVKSFAVAVAGAALAPGLASVSKPVMAADAVKVGVLLPYTGTHTSLGNAISNGLKLAIEENGNKLGGRDVEYVIVDSESHPDKAPENTNKLIVGEGVDFIVGAVHSGVAMGMLKVAREEGTITIIANAGLNAATRELCAPNIFRTSFTVWQTAYPMGRVAVDRGYENVVTIGWNYSFGKGSLAAFEEGFTEAGGNVVKQILTLFPEVEFQSYLTEIASLEPDAVFAFYMGGGAVKFVKDYAAAGLQDSIPLLGSGFVTDGVVATQGEAADGVLTVLHYGEGLDNPADKHFRDAYQSKYDAEANVYAVQGYDSGLLLVQALDAVDGNTDDKEALIAAMEKTEIESPRGTFTFSKAHHPIQNIYLREAMDGQNKVIDIAAESLADPGTGCPMMP